MKRLLCLLSLGMALGVAGNAPGQGPGGPGSGGRGGFGPTPPMAANDARRLEAALDRIDARLKEVEQKLARPAEPAGGRSGPAAFGGGGGGALGRPGGVTGGGGLMGPGAGFGFPGTGMGAGFGVMSAGGPGAGFGMPGPGGGFGPPKAGPFGPPPVARTADFSRPRPPMTARQGPPTRRFDGRPGGPPSDFRGYGPPRGDRPGAGRPADFERRLDRLADEIDQLRREVRQQRR